MEKKQAAKDRLKNVNDARQEMIRQAKGKVMNYAVRETGEEDKADEDAPLSLDHVDRAEMQGGGMLTNPFLAGSKKSTINSDINVVVNDKPIHVNPLHEQWLLR